MLVGSDFLLPPGDVKYLMEYNIIFSRKPSPETDVSWDSLFPSKLHVLLSAMRNANPIVAGVGFVKHPEVSPNLSGLAVFHELHCVV